MRVLPATLLVALVAANAARAAEPRPQGSGLVVRGALGLGLGEMHVAGTSGHRLGIMGGGLVGVAGRRLELDFEAAFQPFRVDNPVGAEAFRVAYFLPSLRLHGRQAYLRLGAGWARYSWSGPQAFVSSDGGPALSAAAGYEFESPRAVPLSIEVCLRTGTSDFEFTSRLLGIQLVASWYARR